MTTWPLYVSSSLSAWYKTEAVMFGEAVSRTPSSTLQVDAGLESFSWMLQCDDTEDLSWPKNIGEEWHREATLLTQLDQQNWC